MLGVQPTYLRSSLPPGSYEWRKRFTKWSFSTCLPVLHPSAEPSPSQQFQINPSGNSSRFSVVSQDPWHCSSQSSHVLLSVFSSRSPIWFMMVSWRLAADLWKYIAIGGDHCTFMPNTASYRVAWNVVLLAAIFAYCKSNSKSLQARVDKGCWSWHVLRGSSVSFGINITYQMGTSRYSPVQWFILTCRVVFIPLVFSFAGLFFLRWFFSSQILQPLVIDQQQFASCARRRRIRSTDFSQSLLQST